MQFDLHLQCEFVLCEQGFWLRRAASAAETCPVDPVRSSFGVVPTAGVEVQVGFILGFVEIQIILFHLHLKQYEL